MPNSTVQDSFTWKIRLLGQVEVEAPSGVVLKISGKKTCELIAYLALNPDRTHTRDRLMDLLWGDSDISHARTRLRQ